MPTARPPSVLLVTLMLGLYGCGSSPPVRYFSLEPMPGSHAAYAEDPSVLGLGPLRVADYLRRSQLVTRGGDGEILIDEFNRWAEPLGTQIHRALASNVDGLLPGVAVVAFPDTDTASIDYRVVGRIHRFDVDPGGLAILDVQWRLEDAEGDDIAAPRRDRYEARARRQDDPASHAAALNDMLTSFSRDIADTVGALIAVE